MMTRSKRRIAIAVTAWAGVCSLWGAKAHGGTESRWLSATSGNWSDPAAWSNGVPDGGYDVVIDAVGSPYLVQVDTATARANSLLLDSPVATLAFQTLELGTLRLNRGTLQAWGATIRGATIYASPEAAIVGSATLDRVVFATDVTFTDGGTDFPSGLDLNGKTLTFQHREGRTYSYLFGPNTSITGAGQIVSDAQYGFESMYLFAQDSNLTIGENVVIRTGTGNVNIGAGVGSGVTASVTNLGQITAEKSRQLGLSNVANDGVIRANGAKLDGYNVENRAGTIIIGTAADAKIEKLVNDGTVRVEGGTLRLWGADNRGEVSVTSGTLSVGPGVYYYRDMPFTNTGVIRLQDSTLELNIPMASDEVDVRFQRTGTRALTVYKDLDNTGRTITVSPTNRLFVAAGGRIIGGTIAGQAGGLVTPESDSSWGTLDGVTLATDWLIEGGAPKITTSLTLANGATIRLGYMSKEYTGIGFGTVQELSGNGRIVFECPNTRVATQDFTIGSGVTIETGAGDGIIGGPWYQQDATIRLVNRGLVRAGNGRTIEVNVGTLESYGALELGDGGEVIVGGDLSLLAEGELLITLGSNRRVPVIVTGDLGLDGKLRVELADGFAPAAGQRFSLFSVNGTSTGSFSLLDLPTLSDGLSWDTSRISLGQLAVVPEPACLAGLWLIAACTIRPRRRLRASMGRI